MIAFEIDSPTPVALITELWAYSTLEGGWFRIGRAGDTVTVQRHSAGTLIVSRRGRGHTWVADVLMAAGATPANIEMVIDQVEAEQIAREGSARSSNLDGEWTRLKVAYHLAMAATGHSLEMHIALADSHAAEFAARFEI